MKKLICIILFGFCLTSVAKSQLIRHDNLATNVKAEVSKNSDVLIYNYNILNSQSSDQLLNSITIEIGDVSKNKGGTLYKITQIQTFGNKWGGWVSNPMANPVNKKAQGEIIWVAEHDTVNSKDDLLSPPKSALSKGQEISLSFKSKGLPKIMRYWAEGWARPYSQSEYDSLRYDVGYSADEISPPWYEDAYQGRTIAPVLPPNPFKHTAFLDTLINQMGRSQSLGWIEDQFFANDLNSQLEQIRDQLVAGDSVKAAIALNDFVGVVKAVNKNSDPSGANLTSEGYALLYYNAKYLLDRLPKPNTSMIPQLPAALTVASERASGAFSADNFSILGGTVHGVLATSNSAKQGFLNGLQPYQEDNITGSGPSPDVVKGQLNFDPNVLIDSVLAHVDQTIPARTSGTFGSPQQPVVLHAQRGLQSSGTISGYGILLVDGQLHVSGTMNWNGLIIQRGRPGVGPNISVSTNLTINGGMLVYNEGPFGASLQVSNKLIIQRSKEAITNLINHLSF